MSIEITAEYAEEAAQDLLKAANNLGAIVARVDYMGRHNWQAIKDEKDAYETIVLSGGDVVKALRVMAMRLDRAALGKS